MIAAGIGGAVGALTKEQHPKFNDYLKELRNNNYDDDTIRHLISYDPGLVFDVLYEETMNGNIDLCDDSGKYIWKLVEKM